MNIKPSAKILRDIASLKSDLRAAIQAGDDSQEKGIRIALREISRSLERDNYNFERSISGAAHGVGKLRMPCSRSAITGRATSLIISS